MPMTPYRSHIIAKTLTSDIACKGFVIISWYTRYDSNVRHLVPKTSALSTELRVHIVESIPQKYHFVLLFSVFFAKIAFVIVGQ